MVKRCYICHKPLDTEGVIAGQAALEVVNNCLGEFKTRESLGSADDEEIMTGEAARVVGDVLDLYSGYLTNTAVICFKCVFSHAKGEKKEDTASQEIAIINAERIFNNAIDAVYQRTELKRERIRSVAIKVINTKLL